GTRVRHVRDESSFLQAGRANLPRRHHCRYRRQRRCAGDRGIPRRREEIHRPQERLSMSPMTVAKLALMLIAAILLAWGIRADDSALRWAGIFFLFAALVLRFFKPRKPRGLS